MATLLMRAGRMADEVRVEAKGLDPSRVLLTLLFLVPFVLGWLVAAAWTGGTWLWTAAVAGYRAGRAQPRKDTST